MTFDTWLDEYGDNLLDFWMYLQDFGRQSGILFFDRITFYEFSQMAYAHSSIPESWVALGRGSRGMRQQYAAVMDDDDHGVSDD